MADPEQAIRETKALLTAKSLRHPSALGLNFPAERYNPAICPAHGLAFIENTNPTAGDLT